MLFTLTVLEVPFAPFLTRLQYVRQDGCIVVINLPLHRGHVLVERVGADESLFCHGAVAPTLPLAGEHLRVRQPAAEFAPCRSLTLLLTSCCPSNLEDQQEHLPYPWGREGGLPRGQARPPPWGKQDVPIDFEN